MCAAVKRAQELVVGGLVPLTTIDFPGKLSAVLFCQGCPWRCVYCHNKHLIPARSNNTVPWNTIEEFLERRRGLLDGVVFSGGEPTMQSAVEEAVKRVFGMGFEVALHTAGQYPERLKRLLPYLSWIGMDIKAPLKKYGAIIQRPLKQEQIERSVEIVVSSGVPFEFRTTVNAQLTSSEDIEEINEWLSKKGAQRTKIQKCRTTSCEELP